MKATQGRRLIALLKRRSYSNLELMMTGISTSHHRRIAESLNDDETLVKTKDRRGLLRYRVW